MCVSHWAGAQSGDFFLRECGVERGREAKIESDSKGEGRRGPAALTNDTDTREIASKTRKCVVVVVGHSVWIWRPAAVDSELQFPLEAENQYRRVGSFPLPPVTNPPCESKLRNPLERSRR